MRSTRNITFILSLALTGCCFTPSMQQALATPTEPPLREMRRTFATSLFTDADRAPAPTPPAGVLELVQYQAPLGANRAYVTPV